MLCKLHSNKPQVAEQNQFFASQAIGLNPEHLHNLARLYKSNLPGIDRLNSRLDLKFHLTI